MAIQNVYGPLNNNNISKSLWIQKITFDTENKSLKFVFGGHTTQYIFQTDVKLKIKVLDHCQKKF